MVVLIYEAIYNPEFRVVPGEDTEEVKQFLEENKKREGVITLRSGLQYKVLKQGAGKHHPLRHTASVVPL
eukprot:4901893-Amphidinium_carterae.1